ncbi:MAG TPA: DUF2147 domain-containing protein [Caulobacteraceae bacterium]|jgi:uncharacterized protein (DUF2147 family)|nr:DUF2147 domain-containing protein [Caulobacteraceae bacterium]
MRRLFLLAASVLTLSAAQGHAASPIAGVWNLEDGGARIRIAPCGRAMCGRLIAADKLRRDPQAKDSRNQDPALRGRSLRNLLVMSGFTGGPERWTGGEVYNPDDGSTYTGEMSLADADTLEVEACVLKPLCKKQTLTRVR